MSFYGKSRTSGITSQIWKGAVTVKNRGVTQFGQIHGKETMADEPRVIGPADPRVVLGVFDGTCVCGNETKITNDPT